MAIAIRRVKVSGPAFEPGVVKRAIDDATLETLKFGRGAIADFTPVDTGLLQSSWFDNNQNTIYNEVPYSVYVEEGTVKMAGRFMAERSVPAIADYYERMLSEKLERLN